MGIMNRIILFIILIIFTNNNLKSQTVIVGESKPVEFLMLPITSSDSPLDLLLHLAFKDENENGILEAGENAELIVTVYNASEGRAQNININLKSQIKDVGLIIEKTSHTIPALFPGSFMSIPFPIKAANNISNNKHEIVINVTEKSGYNFEEIKFTFHTHALEAFKIEYLGLEVIDFGRETIPVKVDGKIQKGEKVELKFHIQNSGKGIAKNVKYELSSLYKTIMLSNESGNIGHLAYGDVAQFSVFLHLSKNYKYDKLPITLNIIAEGSESVINTDLGLEVEKNPAPLRVISLGRELEEYIAKYASFEYTSTKINSNIGTYFPPVFTSQIKNASIKAIGSGYVVPTPLKVTARGLCWSTNLNPTIDNNHTIDGSGPGYFLSHLTGLKASTTYYVRAYATYEKGITYGNQISFTTFELPVLNTTDIDDITAITAMSGGTITSDGGTPITERGVCWNTKGTPTVADNKMTSGSGIGSFTTKLTMLNVNTQYYVRAYAINAAGISYGEEFSFKTKSACDGAKSVSFDGKTYKTIEIGNLCWLQENLNTGVLVQSLPSAFDQSSVRKNNTVEKYCFNNDNNNCTSQGGLYDWAEMMRYTSNEGVQGICPDGWKIPSLGEWNSLIMILGGPSLAGTPTKRGGASGFDAIAAGFRKPTGSFDNQGKTAYFWTSTAIDEVSAWGVMLQFGGSSLSTNSYSKFSGLSVRCIKN